MESMLVNLTSTITYIKANGYKFPKKLGTSNRIVGWICCPICCATCCCWSTTWRFIACPFQCIANGAAFACSDNGCTSITDKIIADCMKGLNETTGPIKAASVQDLKTASRDQMNRMLQILNDLDSMFAIVLMHNRYDICEKLVAPLMITFGFGNSECTPYMACSVIKQMHTELGNINIDDVYKDKDVPVLTTADGRVK